MNDHRLTDDDIKRLLVAVADEASLGHPGRDELRRAVLTEFRSLVGSADGPAAVDHDAADAEVIELTTDRSSLRGSGGSARTWPRLTLAVAASLLVAVASVVLVQQSPDQSVDASDVGVPSLVGESSDEAGPVAPGRYSVEDVGGGIELTLPENVVVADAGPGFVELRPADDEWGSSLFIMTAEGSLEDLLDGYQAEGLITAIRKVGTSADDLVTEFEVRPTNDARSDECRGDRACVAIGATSFDTTGVNLARQVDGPGDQSIWTLYASDTAFAPFTRDANSILESIDFPPEPSD